MAASQLHIHSTRSDNYILKIVSFSSLIGILRSSCVKRHQLWGRKCRGWRRERAELPKLPVLVVGWFPFLICCQMIVELDAANFIWEDFLWLMLLAGCWFAAILLQVTLAQNRSHFLLIFVPLRPLSEKEIWKEISILIIHVEISLSLKRLRRWN